MSEVVRQITRQANGTFAESEISRVRYDYDSNGNRVSSEVTESGVVRRTEYLTDERNPTGYSQVLQETEFDGNGAKLRRVMYVIGHDQIAQTTQEFESGSWNTGVTATFGTDGHGSVRVLLDAAAAIIDSGALQIYHYDAYGNLLNFPSSGTQPGASQPLTSYLYSGESFDLRIGQQYLRARWYDATTGRFNRLDPFAGNSSDPQSIHKYAYVHGDPVQGVDPTGKFLGAVIGLGIEFAMPGPGDLIQAGLEALVQAYAANLEWDIEWAQDLSLPDSWGSRLDDTWVYSALGAGLHDAYDVWTPFGTFNPLDTFATDFAAKRTKPGLPTSMFFGFGGRASFSFHKKLNYRGPRGAMHTARVNFYTTPKLNGAYVVRFNQKDIAFATGIVPTNPHKLPHPTAESRKKAARSADIAAANEKLAKQRHGYTFNKNGTVTKGHTTYTWHHDINKGNMQLVPQEVHSKLGGNFDPSIGLPEHYHIGFDYWWNPWKYR